MSVWQQACPRKSDRVDPPRRAGQPVGKIAREAGLSLGPVAGIAKAKRLSRLSALHPRIAIIGYEKKPPGEMILAPSGSPAAHKGPDTGSPETGQDTMGIATSDAAGVSEKHNRGIDHGS